MSPSKSGVVIADEHCDDMISERECDRRSKTWPHTRARALRLGGHAQSAASDAPLPSPSSPSLPWSSSLLLVKVRARVTSGGGRHTCCVVAARIYGRKLAILSGRTRFNVQISLIVAIKTLNCIFNTRKYLQVFILQRPNRLPPRSRSQPSVVQLKPATSTSLQTFMVSKPLKRRLF